MAVGLAHMYGNNPPPCACVYMYIFLYSWDIFSGIADKNHDMDIFVTIEREIGPFNTWPSYILKYLFCKPLNDYRSMVLSAFFYGNGVSEYRTVELIKDFAPDFSVTDGSAIQNWFTKWNKSRKARSNKRYYNLIQNEVRDLNAGKAFLQTGVSISLHWQKDFEGLNEEHIETITSVFRRW